MKFPGRRKTKHYFPVSESSRIAFDSRFQDEASSYVIGIEQPIVDVEAHVEDSFLEKYNIPKGESIILEKEIAEAVYQELLTTGKIVGEFAGGAIGNTIHNYSVLADDRSVLLGAINETIKVGDYAYKYICTTNSHVDLSSLMPCKGMMAQAICFITPDHERTFGINKGIMNELSPDYVPDSLVRNSSALLVTAFTLRDSEAPIYEAVHKAVRLANQRDIPVILALGTASLVRENREVFTRFIEDHVNIIATNELEAEALVEETDPLLASEKMLDLCDMVLLTNGKKGLYVCAHVDEHKARKTKDQIHSKSLPEYNKYEYSRPMLKSSCKKPIKIYTHINPFMGGPGSIKNTNGAGDGALSALLHDLVSNAYHRKVIPNSPKHDTEFLTYSSIHQVAKYANRVSYEILRNNSPRLTKGLPEREESLEENYWAK